MKLVQFSNGKWGVRRGFWPSYRFADLKNPSFWWDQSSGFLPDCMGTKEQALERLVSHRVVPKREWEAGE